MKVDRYVYAPQADASATIAPKRNLVQADLWSQFTAYSHHSDLCHCLRDRWLMVSLNDGEDPHFRKAEFDPKHCPKHCDRPCERVCPTQAIQFSPEFAGVIDPLCYGCGRCLPICPWQDSCPMIIEIDQEFPIAMVDSIPVNKTVHIDITDVATYADCDDNPISDNTKQCRWIVTRSRRSFWKPVLIAFLCGLSIVSAGDRAVAQSLGSRKSIQRITAERKALIVEIKASFPILIQKMNRLEALWKAGAVSDIEYRQAQSDVASAQKQLNQLICDDLVSPNIFTLMAQLRLAIRQKERYQTLRDAGAISNIEFLNVAEKATILQEYLDDEIENDPVSKKHINKTKECRDWGT